jgi:alpha-glucosidase
MKKVTFLLLLFLAAGNVLNAQSGLPVIIGSIKSVKRTGYGIAVKTENASALISSYSPTVIRVRIDREMPGDDFSYAVIQQPSPAFKEIRETKEAWILSTDSLHLEVMKKPFSIRMLKSGNQLICVDYEQFPYSWLGTEVSCCKALFPDEKFIGLGEKTGNLNKRGNNYENWNSDVPAYAANADPLYQTIPFYIGIHDKVTYGIFFDNTYRTRFNFGASTDEKFMSFSACGGEMNYYFFGASSVAGVIRDYTWLTGRMPMPPVWSLGYQQCRWSYYPEAEVIKLAQSFREKQIPCDMIYLDIDYMDAFKIFTWNRERFPDPEGMIRKLNAMGFHLATIVDPGIKIDKDYFAYNEGLADDYFVTYPGGEKYTGNVWPGRCHFPDFTRAAVRKWWGGNFSRLTVPGVEGFWNDMNEPSAWGQSIPDFLVFDNDGHKSAMAAAHNIYGLNMARGTFEGTKELMKGKRPFVLTRAGYSGIQRYSAVWTGDNEATDEHMLLSARMVCGLGISGVSFTGPDLGGFIGNPSRELYARWLSLGVYTPFFRNHSAWDTKSKEPWSFGRDIENLSKELISQRYRLIPYIYSGFFASARTGMPLARTLAINYTFDEKIWWLKYQNEYMFGDNMLVAPVSCNQDFAKVYLPDGGWYRLGSDEYYQGKQEVTVEAPLNNLPVFARASGFLPMQSVIQSTSEKPCDTLFLNLFSGDNPGTFIYYEDDGLTYNFEHNDFYKRDFRFDPANKQVILGNTEGSYKSVFSKVKLIFHGFHGITSVTADGSAIPLLTITLQEQATVLQLTKDEIRIQYK